jgi:hypothetical protein
MSSFLYHARSDPKWDEVHGESFHSRVFNVQTRPSQYSFLRN